MQRYTRAEARGGKLVDPPRDFAASIGRAVEDLSKATPSLTFPDLKRFNTTISQLDFDTGVPDNSNGPALLNLRSVEEMDKIVLRAEPWYDHFGHRCNVDFEPGSPQRTDTQGWRRYRTAKCLAKLVRSWLSGGVNMDETVLSSTDWHRYCHRNVEGFIEGPERHPESDEYIWRCGGVYHSLNPMEEVGYNGCRPDQPHAIYHAVDSTPFEDSEIRMSEFKSIVFLAIANNMRDEYSHLDYFGVTVLSFCDCDVRIVQGLVSLKTHNIDLRVSPVQNFSGGVWKDGCIDKRFLRLLSYNCPAVILQSK